MAEQAHSWPLFLIPAHLFFAFLQDQREEGLKGFRDGTFPVLVATDVAGRGIDVPDVSALLLPCS